MDDVVPVTQRKTQRREKQGHIESGFGQRGPYGNVFDKEDIRHPDYPYSRNHLFFTQRNSEKINVITRLRQGEHIESHPNGSAAPLKERGG